MSKATDIAARAAKLSERRPGRETTPTRAAPPRAKPIRVTTDLSPQDYRHLVAYCADLAEHLGQAKVPHTEVIRALINRLEQDSSLRETITDDIKAKLSK